LVLDLAEIALELDSCSLGHCSLCTKQIVCIIRTTEAQVKTGSPIQG
jgi:hypothetical protein